jgi:hypothetical protein
MPFSSMTTDWTFKRRGGHAKIALGAYGFPSKEIRGFGTMARDSMTLWDGHREDRRTRIAKESTVARWKKSNPTEFGIRSSERLGRSRKHASIPKQFLSQP